MSKTKQATRRTAAAAGVAAIAATAALVPAAHAAGPFTAAQRVIDPLYGVQMKDLAVGPGGAAAVAFEAGQTPPSQYESAAPDTRLWVAVHEQGAQPTAALPRGFKLAEPVTAPGRGIWSAQVGVDAAGNTTLAYWLRLGASYTYPEPPTEVFVRYRPANGGWSEPQLLNTQYDGYDDPSITPDLKVASNGRAIVATDGGLYERAPGAAAFTAIANTDTVRKVAMNSRGDVAATFVNGRTEGDVSVRTRPVGGAWTSKAFGKLYNAYPFFLDYTAVGITESGLVGASWAAQDGGLVFAQRTPGATFATGTWSAAEQINNTPGADFGQYTNFEESILPESSTKLAVRWRQNSAAGGSGDWERRERIFPGSTPSIATPDFLEFTKSNRPYAVSPTAAGRGVGIVNGGTSIAATLRLRSGDAWGAPQSVIAPTGTERYGGGHVALDSQGNGYVAWARTYPAVGTTPAKSLVGISGYDPVSPAITAVTVTAATVGQPVTFTAVATDRQSVPKITWSFGDGTTGTGSPVSHIYAKAGTFTAKATAKDEAGNSASWNKTVVVAAK